MADSKVKWVLSIVLLIIVGAVIWSKDAIMAAWAKWRAGTDNGGGGGGGGGGTQPPQFPVCLSSSDADIVAAFIASGMIDAFQVSWNNGSYPTYATWAAFRAYIVGDPHGWLTGHPYLYNAYPDYFVAP